MNYSEDRVMKIRMMFATAAIPAALLTASSASAAVTVARTAAPAPTYSTTLNFDEPGGPTGANVPVNSWASIGLSVLDSGAGGGGFVGNLNGTFPWLPNNNVWAGAFGAFMTFSTDLTEFSTQTWDSGAPGPFGGGFAVVALDSGVEVANQFYPDVAWGGLGDTWINITTSGGSTFDEVRILGFGFPPETYLDNMSWNAVPAPGALALLGLAGIVARRRRRD